MKIKLICHASVVIESPDAVIWTDPWLFGKAFNDSWTLFPTPAFDPEELQRIQYIFISHEHPDHFHIPTLKSLPDEFKARVRILFQKQNTEKVFAAMRGMGYRNFQSLANRRITQLTPKTRIYCYQAGSMDSCLGVMSSNQTILNVNDAKIDAKDCRSILKDIEKVDAHLNQFSLAGYGGYINFAERLPRQAALELQNPINNHRDLRAKVTIPFASFVYFSCLDNKHINAYVNRPRDIWNILKDECAVLFPGDTYQVGSSYDSQPALRRFDDAYRKMGDLPCDAPKHVDLPTIKSTFLELANHMRDKYPASVLSVLHSVSVYIPDLEKNISFSISRGTFVELDGSHETDLTVNSQPLHFAFKFPYGVQTLGVSGRFFIKRNFGNWKRHRIIFSMNNAAIYLKPRYFFKSSNLKYILSRIPGGINQVLIKLKSTSN